MGRAQLEPEYYKKSYLGGFLRVQWNKNKGSIKKLFFFHFCFEDSLRGTTAIFCGQDLRSTHTQFVWFFGRILFCDFQLFSINYNKYYTYPGNSFFNLYYRYIIPGKMTACLYKNALNTKHIYLEDVFVTGIVAQSCGFRVY